MGESRLKCPNCGAENADRGFYCGSCAAQLREFEAAGRNDEPALYIPPQLASVTSGFHMRWLTVATVLGAVLAAIGLVSEDFDPFKILQVAMGVLLVAFSVIMRRKMRSADYVRLLTNYMSQGPPVEQEGMSTSARSVPLMAVGALAMVAALGAVFIVVGVYAEPRAVNAGWTVAIAMGVGFLAMTAFAAARITNEIRLSSSGIHVHNPRMNTTVHFVRDNIAEAAVSGRVLRVTLKQAPFGMVRRSTHIIRGDLSKRTEFSQAMVLYDLERMRSD